MTKILNLVFQTSNVTICYGRNGHRLYKGPKENIPEYLLNYYVGIQIINEATNSTYIEVTEDAKFWE